MKQLAAILVISLASFTLNAQTKVYNDPGNKKSATYSIEKNESTNSHRVLDAKSASKGNTAEMPADFPQYINTGNPESDNQVYESAKAYWYSTHPEEAEKRFGPNKQTKKAVITKDELNNMSPERQKLILAHPERYEIKN